MKRPVVNFSKSEDKLSDMMRCMNRVANIEPKESRCEDMVLIVNRYKKLWYDYKIVWVKNQYWTRGLENYLKINNRREFQFMVHTQYEEYSEMCIQAVKRIFPKL